MDISFGGKKNPDAGKKARRARMQQERVDSKRKDAEERQAYAATRSPQQKLASLDKKFGPGQGAVKERARLNAKLAPKVQPDKLDQLAENLTKQISAVLQEVTQEAKKMAEEELGRRNKRTKTDRAKNSSRSKKA